MNRLIEWWARNSVAANLAMVGIFVAGLFGFAAMEREMDPQVRFPGLQIVVSWPGAAPQEVEEQIVSRIEEAVSDLDNIEWVRSMSAEGVGEVYILAEQSVDFSRFMNDVKIRVDSISSLPRDIEPPRVQQWVNRNEFIRVAVHGDLGERKLKRLAEQLRREAASLPAISVVELFGIRPEEVSIEVSESAMRRYGLSFQDVADAIRANSLNQSAGTVRTEVGSYQLKVRNQADTEQEFADIIVRQTADGGTIRVGDVATVVDGFEDNEILATLNGEPAVLIQVMTTETMDIVTASESIRNWIAERRKTLPAGANLTLWTDNAEDFKGRLNTIGNSAVQGLILVLLVLLFTLRPKVAFWVAMGIATAYAGAFVLLPSVGVSLNMLSTFAFLLVLGIVVDDAIVVGESIHTESHKSGGGLSAAVLGTQLVAKPVIFAVVTTIFAFLPWLFLSGSTSEFTRHITWVVILALLFSLIESLLILPAHLSNLKPRKKLGRFGRMQKRIADGIVYFAQHHYRRIGSWAVERRYLTLSIFIAVLMIGFGMFSSGWVKKSFMPEIESDEIIVNVVMPEGAPYSRALEVLAQLQDAEKALEEEVNQRTGGEGALIENWYTRSRRDSVLAIVKLAPPEVRDMSAKEAAVRLRELMGDVPDAKEVSVRYTRGDDSPGFELSIRHPDLNLLRAATADLEAQLRTYESLYDVRNNLEGASEEIRITLKPGAAKLGLTLAEVNRQVRQAYFGEEVQRLPRAGQDVKVMVRYPLASRRSIESLKDFRVRTSDGREVPLLAVAELEYAPGIKRIQRWNGNRAARVMADLKADVRGDIMKDLDENFFPQWEKRYPGIIRGAVGQAEGEQRFIREVIGLYTMAFFAMYSLLAVAFRSYFQPILILIAIPFAIVGAIFGHSLLNMTMAIFSYFGIAAAAGVVVNDNLVLMDCCNRLRDKGMQPLQAIVEAGVARFRPILLTTTTTIIGLIPMMLERSIQAAFLQPIVVALAFGVFMAFFVTLLLVPALYAIGVDIVSLTGRTRGHLLGLLRGRMPPSRATAD
ncbi:Multidrug efflux pump subunit AcrB [Microbulbifer thermotolerans]|uniref:Efflux RND transporter permease subunit n=1 Tax=Microbulbifer thermotolerans TaxID=252514 RepID=A0AB35HUG4_MICTH|nr:efflux RND transporter permease subunit [Microbulbifer thermotolerans]MCX2801193.1 efflux RND transporter permease subunit [Microbulbifer thermotolerans]MCX2835267.1 efflux RND transporter permease subunit [Microbulbifer thermotolerans]MCX2841384.1 efflux RND transporter permease subunit [Microbulbifer thermotolerans]WKT60201.1 efflux RND transporter permease subunit [Microbulbifer thermotolerans]SFD01784.1 Multidrug efflux pump subunit AcrB [Microbulbifer thermotolerans]